VGEIAESYDNRYRFIFDDGVVLCRTKGRYSNQYEVVDVKDNLLGIAECRTVPGRSRPKKTWYAIKDKKESGPYTQLKMAAEYLLASRGA